MTKRYCIICGRECFGFWKYGPTAVCSLAHMRQAIAEGKVERIPPYSAFPELGIMAPKKHVGVDMASGEDKTVYWRVG